MSPGFVIVAAMKLMSFVGISMAPFLGGRLELGLGAEGVGIAVVQVWTFEVWGVRFWGG